VVQKSTGNQGKVLSEEWHQTRLEARLSLGEFEWSDIDITRYDLDTIDFDRTMRPTKTDPVMDTEGSPESGEPIQGYDEDPVRD